MNTNEKSRATTKILAIAYVLVLKGDRDLILVNVPHITLGKKIFVKSLSISRIIY